MTALFVYLVKVNIALIIFCAGYYAVLRHLTFYTLNRVYLVAAILFATLYPLVNFQDLLNRHQEIARPVQLVIINWQTPVTHAVQQAQQHNKWYWLELMFWAGVIVLAVRFITQLLSLYRLHRQSKPMQLHQYFVRVIHGDINPFSFWKSIYINPDNHEPDELKAILAHEQVHVSEWHTLDILLGELSTIFYWFNPGVWLMKRAIRENIEFITDRKILQDGSDPKTYQYSLLNVTFNGSHNAIVNHFNTSTIKKRIMMMNSKKSSKINLTRYAILVPAVIALVLVFTVSKAELGKQVVKGNAVIANAINTTINTITPISINHVTVATKRNLMILPNAVQALFSESISSTIADTPKVVKIIGTVNNKEIIVVGYGRRKNDTVLVLNGGGDAQTLIKKLPGVTVTSDGKLDASGQEVRTMKLNGITYYAPANNMRADSISKIQVVSGYAVKSDDPNGVTIRSQGGGVATAGNSLHNDNQNTPPLIVVNGKVENGAIQIDQNNIASMTVLRDKTASDLYGEKAKDGAILITTKTDPPRIVRGYGLAKSTEPVYIVNGNVLSKSTGAALNGNQIQGVTVTKDGITYSDDKKPTGVINITTANKNKITAREVLNITAQPGVINFNAKNIFTGKLLLLNGKETTERELNKLPVDSIKLIKPLTEKEKAKYGDKAKNGGFAITTIK